MVRQRPLLLYFRRASRLTATNRRHYTLGPAYMSRSSVRPKHIEFVVTVPTS